MIAVPKESVGVRASEEVKAGPRDSDGVEYMLVRILEELKELSTVKELSEVVSVNIEDIRNELKANNELMLRFSFPPRISKSGSDNSRRSAKNRYIPDGVEKAMNLYFCTFTGRWFPSEQVVMGHIFMKQWPRLWLMETFQVKISDPENILPIWSAVEVEFDAFGITVIPESNDDFRIIILNPALRGKLIKAGGECELKFDDLDGKLLEFKTAARPAKRLVGFRARLAIRYAKGKNWIAREEVRVPEAAWSSPTFDNKLMARFLEDDNSLASKMILGPNSP